MAIGRYGRRCVSTKRPSRFNVIHLSVIYVYHGGHLPELFSVAYIQSAFRYYPPEFIFCSGVSFIHLLIAL
ncbi:hypothetical protein DFJ43DRAFT_1108220 [Lentinula guzmanii]|uniref:Uncharacterized protein n=1 Tax=Lentinula guzmanii TaxID=2804957 RepID=A0AA38J7P3_9AGAR|nr:hypothetical protein DFJ43DRAFT_1108220 [Lentinula guzmanii]